MTAPRYILAPAVSSVTTPASTPTLTNGITTIRSYSRQRRSGLAPGAARILQCWPALISAMVRSWGRKALPTIRITTTRNDDDQKYLGNNVFPIFRMLKAVLLQL